MTSEPPRPPDRPHPDECCGRGCSPCIFDYYDSALERWAARMRAVGLDPKEALKARGEDPPADL